MAQAILDNTDLDFVLFEQFKIDKLSEFDKFADFNKKVIKMVVKEARNLAVKEILPTSKIGDQTGCRFEKGSVLLPDEFKQVWNLLSEGEWLVPDATPEWGGQGMPKSVALAAKDYLNGANIALFMIAGLSHGASHAIEKFGTPEQKKIYLEKIISGEWATAMDITESEAGSDLSGISTIAESNGDGTYSLTGSKIFITGGDHNLTDNIVHLVLARIKGAPEGSRGLSLFLVPSVHVDENGKLGEKNDIACTGIEEKMGLHGSPTCSISLGSSGKCIGTLVGEENKGLLAMFSMMNDARLLVGSQGHASASSAYLHALEYARTRIQGILPGADKNPVAIIEHPDVKRMLLTMKAYTEGIRSILFYIARCQDKEQVIEDEKEKEICRDLVDFLIPIGKGYVTDRALEVCDMAIQVFGGYGYTCEYPVEQIYRDVRISTIYEGTNGIQAIDLIGRKLTMKNGRLFNTLINQIKDTIDRAKTVDALSSPAMKLETMASNLEDIAGYITGLAATPEKAYQVGSLAALFLHVTGDVVLAWMLLWRAAVAQELLESTSKKKQVVFYQGQIHTARFFIETMGPITLGRMRAITESSDVLAAMSSDAFGGR